jgi:hypothetical protein
VQIQDLGASSNVASELHFDMGSLPAAGPSILPNTTMQTNLTKNIHSGSRRGTWATWPKVLSLAMALVGTGHAADTQIESAWDQSLLSTEIGNVDIEEDYMENAWRVITTRYLLRANMYVDRSMTADRTNHTSFKFHNNRGTCKELIGAFLNTYSSFTWTQNPATGIVWVYPKRVNYNDILSQRVRVPSTAHQVPMYTGVYLPLCKLLAPDVVDPRIGSPMRPGHPWLYDVDLPAGIYSAREILDFCCAANPTKSFLVRQESDHIVIYPNNLTAANLVDPPRPAAISFWKVNIGQPSGAIPTYDDVRAAMSSSNARQRSAASFYLEACEFNYKWLDLIDKAKSPDQAIWTMLGVQYATWRDAEKTFFSRTASILPRVRDDLEKIEDPALALLVWSQLNREEKNTSYLDTIVSKHVYTEEEIAGIKPELYRMARSSKRVRDKLLELRSQAPQLSSHALDELPNTNLFTLVTGANK